MKKQNKPKKMIIMFGVLIILVSATVLSYRYLRKNETMQQDENKVNVSDVNEEIDFEYSNPDNKNRHIIIDSDTGADDASAIILAAKEKDIDIVGITTLVGNVDLEQSAKNAIMALEVAGREVPVYKGSKTDLDGGDKVGFSVYGNDGMGDKGLIHPKGDAKDENAVDFIIDSAKKYPGELEIVSLGPATNIARAIQKDPEAMKNVKMIWSMATSGLGPGNATPVAEFNVYLDALAYKIIIDFGVPITIIGYDMCIGDSQWTDEDFDKLSKYNDVGEFVAKSFSSIRDIYRKTKNEGKVTNCDTLAMTCVLYPDFIKKSEKCHASCVVEECEAFGEVIFYRHNQVYDMVKGDFVNNVTLVTEVDGKNFFENYLKKIQ